MAKTVIKCPAPTQLPSGKWRMRIRKRGIDIAENFITRKNAERWGRQKLIDIEAGLFKTPDEEKALPTIGELITENRRHRDVMPGSNLYSLMRLLEEWFMPYPVKELTPELINKFIMAREGATTRLRKNGGTYGPVKPPTIRKDLVCLRSAMQWAEDFRGVSECNSRSITIAMKYAGKRVSHGVPRDRVLSRREIDLLLNDNRLATLGEFCILTGLRRKEAILARPEMVKDKYIKIYDTKTEPIAIRYMLPRAQEILEENPNGLCSCRTKWNLDFTFFREKHELQDLKPHDMRHTCATYAIRAGIPAYIAMMITGHESEKSFSRYVNLGASSLDADEYHPDIMRHFADFADKMDKSIFRG